MKASLGFDLRSLEVFVAAGNARSMTLAAERLGMTQSAISQIIAQLERTFGVPLLDRKTRPFHLTVAGEAVRHRAVDLLHAAQLMPGAIRRLDTGLPPRLRLGLVDSLASPFVPEFLLRLKGLLNHLSVTAGLAHSLRDALLDHTLDMIISNDPMGLADRLPLVRWSARSYIGADLERHFRRMRLDVPRQLEFDSSETLIGIVSVGLGWAVMTPLCLMNSSAQLSGIRLLPFPGAGLSRHLDLLARAGELDGLTKRVADLSRRILREKYLPGMYRMAPWLRGRIRIRT